MLATKKASTAERFFVGNKKRLPLHPCFFIRALTNKPPPHTLNIATPIKFRLAVFCSGLLDEPFGSSFFVAVAAAVTINRGDGATMAATSLVATGLGRVVPKAVWAVATSRKWVARSRMGSSPVVPQ